MIVSQITNHVQAALNRFMQQYQAIPSQYTLNLPITDEEFQVSALFAIMATLVDQCQAIENAGFGVDSGRQLWNGTTTPAQGEQIDNLGTLFDLSRNGLSDSQYLAFLFGTIAENNSDTTIPTMVNIAAVLFQVTSLVALEMYPAEFNFEIPNTSPLSATLYSTVANIIQASLGGGIGLGFISMYAPAAAFALDSSPPVLVTTGNIINGHNTITGLGSTTGVYSGITVTGAGIPAGTTATFSGSTATLSKNCTQTLNTVGVVFGGTNDNLGCGDLNDTNAGGGLASLIYNNPAA